MLGFYPIFQPFKENKMLKELSAGALRLYIYLGLSSGNLTGETWVSLETIAKYFEVSQRSVSQWFKELETFRLVDRIQFEFNGPSHTFLLPYGREHFGDPNSVRKDKQ